MLDVRLEDQLGQLQLSLDLHLPDRGITAIFGPSGSGKTTLLRCIAGLHEPASGRIRFRQQVWLERQSGDRRGRSEQQLPTWQRPIGYVFQEAGLFSHLSVENNLRYGYSRIPDKARRIGWQDAIEATGIDGLLTRQPQTLSGGERQRVALARALLTSPQLLLCDEPLAALDASARLQLMNYLEAICRDFQLPCLYVTHSVAEVARLADHLLLMEQGRCLDSGAAEQLMTRLDLPLGQRADAEALLLGQVINTEFGYGLCQIECDSQALLVPQQAHRAIGTPVRVQVLARDVSLSLEPPNQSSILNSLRCTIDALQPEGDAYMRVRLRLREQTLLARLTRYSADRLQLRDGMAVYAQIKAVALVNDQPPAS
ncbi:molybdenum ABC transporter ATP-binding protein [Pokkaliibacter sp. CJK22405]|uniref:molybdenum ABC transporter ATP-binding protein n=1 Tax=Pokkaliibacter sp. CJK22405 TaxID=3384615 RepID=UPI0039851A4A